uniref:Uncharacterized protein n=1 Tax=Arundo donax TaxID=35708 RepID=A0A0A9FBR7_ARUDO
MRESAVGSDL